MKILILAQHLAQALGGIEIQCDLLARGLAARGHAVVYGGAGRLPEAAGLAYAVAAWRPEDPASLAGLIAAHRPDVIYFRHNKIRLRSSARTARAHAVPFVFAASSQQDAQAWAYHRSAAPWSPRRLVSVAWQCAKSRWNWDGFRCVDGAISLSAALLGRLPVARREHIPDSMEPDAEPFAWPRPFVAWVAALKHYKHPEAFVELARRCTDLDVDFLMVGGVAHADLEWIAAQRGTPANFHYLGPRTPTQVNGFLAASMLMVHTCDPEGFGNNFIQAWLQARPTLSLVFDPDGLIEGQRLGRVPGSMDGLERELRRLLSDPGKREEIGQRALAHARANYLPETNVARVEAFLQGVVDQRAGARRPGVPA